MAKSKVIATDGLNWFLQDHHPQLVGCNALDRIVVFNGNPAFMGSLTQVHIYKIAPPPR